MAEDRAGARRDPDGSQPFWPNSWFTYAFRLAAGALLAYLLVQELASAGHVFVLLLMSAFLAMSLEPLVKLLVARGITRQLAVFLVALLTLAVVAGLLAVVLPPVVEEINALVKGTPHVLSEIRDRSTWLGKLENKYHLIEKAQKAVSSDHFGTVAVNGIVGAGKVVFNLLTSTLAVTALTLYFLAGMPGILRFSYRLAPASNRERVSRLTEQIVAQVGRYMVGKVVTSAIAGIATYAWAAPFGIPFPAALGVMVGLMDMIPVIGSTIGGVIVTLVALSVSIPVAIATLGFYVVFRLVEDYLLMPKVMRQTVDVHPVITVIAVLVGGSLLGIVGALVSIPVAAAIKLIVTEVVQPRLDRL
jgi:predicted PurR-regulated permease PerM